MWQKPTHLFSPQDVGDSAVWLESIKVQLREIKKEQALFHVSEHPPKNLDDVMALVDDLLHNKEYKNIIRIGRGYLKIKEYDKCLRLFKYVLKKTPKTEEFYYTFQANCAYSLIGLKEYRQAVQFLLKIEDRLGEKTAVWHLAAFAYCYKMMNDNEKFDKYYHLAVGCPNFSQEKIVFQRVYPEVNWEHTLLSANGLN
jgi:tetratricopeptide (TPR) repeat protein